MGLFMALTSRPPCPSSVPTGRQRLVAHVPQSSRHGPHCPTRYSASSRGGSLLLPAPMPEAGCRGQWHIKGCVPITYRVANVGMRINRLVLYPSADLHTECLALLCPNKLQMLRHISQTMHAARDERVWTVTYSTSLNLL